MRSKKDYKSDGQVQDILEEAHKDLFDMKLWDVMAEVAIKAHNTAIDQAIEECDECREVLEGLRVRL